MYSAALIARPQKAIGKPLSDSSDRVFCSMVLLNLSADALCGDVYGSDT